MADTFALSDAPDAVATADPGVRGTLFVSTATITHMAEAASRHQSETVVQRGLLRQVAGSGYPRAKVTMRGQRVWITLDVAATWPVNASELVKKVRDHVRAELTRLTDLVIEAVDVTLHFVDSDDTPTRRVV